VSQQVQGVDLFPTVAHLLGLAPPAGLPGQDLLGTPEPRDAVSETASALAPDGTPTDLASLRTPQSKLIEMPLVPRRELYDLARDPASTTTAGARLPTARRCARGWIGSAPPRRQPCVPTGTTRPSKISSVPSGTSSNRAMPRCILRGRRSVGLQ
jgi:hypothetical protein